MQILSQIPSLKAAWLESWIKEVFKIIILWVVMKLSNNDLTSKQSFAISIIDENVDMTMIDNAVGDVK